jgi:uncharacterized protein YndB with AHSA1/START domain
MTSVKRIQFTEDIAAPVQRVSDLMLDPKSYRTWTSAFAEGCYFAGSWERGRRIKFLAPSGDGMVAEIAEHRPCEFISIRHLGFIANGVEDTESEAIRAWAPAYENYTFHASSTGTTLVVDLDVTEEPEAYMVEAWPKALKKLKAICEAE